MNRKAIIINGIILGLLASFVVISITFYYLVPAMGSFIAVLKEAIEELIGIINIWS